MIARAQQLSVSAVILVLSLSACAQRTSTRAGTEVFSIVEEWVDGVTLVGAIDRVVVKRDATTQRFRYRFVRDGRETTCGASSQRDAAVRRLFSVRTVEMLDGEHVKSLLAAPAKRWIDVTVTSTSKDLEPFRLSVLDTPEGARRVEALRRDVGDAFTIDPRWLDLWWMDCGKH
jgi:hypothetical protein